MKVLEGVSLSPEKCAVKGAFGQKRIFFLREKEALFGQKPPFWEHFSGER